MSDDNSVKIGSDTIPPARECGDGCKRYTGHWCDPSGPHGTCRIPLNPIPSWSASGYVEFEVNRGQHHNCPAFVPVTVEGKP